MCAERETKSISEERTYTDDLTDLREIDRELLARAEGSPRSLRRDGLVGRTVHLKVRTGDFTTWTRALTAPRPRPISRTRSSRRRARCTASASTSAAGGAPPRRRHERHRRGGELAGSLFPDASTERSRKLARASDAVNDKLGEDVVTRASLLRRKNRVASSLPSVD